MRTRNDDLAHVLVASAEEYKSTKKSLLAGFFHGKTGLYRANNIIIGVNEDLNPVVLLAALLNSTSNGLKKIVLNKLICGAYNGLMSENGSYRIDDGNHLSSILFDKPTLEKMKSDFDHLFDHTLGEYPTAEWRIAFNKEKAVKSFIESYRNALTDPEREIFDSQINSGFLDRKSRSNQEGVMVMRNI